MFVCVRCMCEFVVCVCSLFVCVRCLCVFVVCVCSLFVCVSCSQYVFVAYVCSLCARVCVCVCVCVRSIVRSFVDWLIDWLIGWLVDWLIGWSIFPSFLSFIPLIPSNLFLPHLFLYLLHSSFLFSSFFLSLEYHFFIYTRTSLNHICVEDDVFYMYMYESKINMYVCLSACLSVLYKCRCEIIYTRAW